MSTKKVTHKIGDQVETKVRSWMFGKTPNKGTKYVKIQFEGFIEKTIWPWSSPEATAQAMKVLDTLGFKGIDLSMLTYDDAIDKTKFFLATIDDVRTKDGKSYYSASWINDPDKVMGGFKSNDLTADELDEYTLSTESYIEGAVDITPPASTQDHNQNYSTAPTENSFAADDIPF